VWKRQKLFTYHLVGKVHRLIVLVVFLPKDHPFRRSKRSFRRSKDEKDDPSYMYTGEDAREAVRYYPKLTYIGWRAKLPGYGDTHHWTKRSIFWDLPYWKDN